MPSDVYSCIPWQDSCVLPLPELPVCWCMESAWKVKRRGCGWGQMWSVGCPISYYCRGCSTVGKNSSRLAGVALSPGAAMWHGSLVLPARQRPLCTLSQQDRRFCAGVWGMGKGLSSGSPPSWDRAGRPRGCSNCPASSFGRSGKGAPGWAGAASPGALEAPRSPRTARGGAAIPAARWHHPRVETGAASTTAPGWRAAGRRTRSEDRRPGGKAEGGREAGGAGRTGGRWQCRRAGRRRLAGQRAAPPHLSPAPRSEVEVSGGGPGPGRSGAQRRGWAVGALRGAGGWGPVRVALVPGAAGHPAPGSVALLRRCWWRRGAGRQRRCLGCAPGPALHTCRRGRRGWVRRGRRAPGRCGGKMLLGGVYSLTFHVSVPNAGNTAGLPGVWSSSVFERLHRLFVLCEVVACAFLCVGSFY